MSSYRFFTDILSILGIGPITNLVPVFKIFGVFKTIRVLRLSEYISKLNLNSLTKSVLNLIKLIIYLSLFLHMIACIWYITVKQNADKLDETGRSFQWYPPTDWISYKDSKLFTDEISLVQKYNIMFYHAILIIGINEMGPCNELECLVITLILISASIINSQLFAEIAVIISNFQREDSCQQEIRDSTNHTMNQLNIPSYLQDEIRYFMQKTQFERTTQNEFDAFMSKVSPSFQQAILRKVFLENLADNIVIFEFVEYLDSKKTKKIELIQAKDNLVNLQTKRSSLNNIIGSTF